MNASTHEASRALRLSVWLYRRLLVAYPQLFRREYGARMVQVFRDCCREAAATDGTAGLLRYWLIACGDLIVSALAERRQEELHMTRTLWIRLGSLAAIIGSIVPALVSALILSIALVNLLAPHMSLRLDTPYEIDWAYIAQWILFVPALIGLLARSANRAGVFGWTGIAFAMVGAIIGVGGNLFRMSAMQGDARQLYASINVIHLGSVLLASGMILYGATALKYRLLPRLTWLPLVVGLTELLDITATSVGIHIFPQGSDAYLLKILILVMTTYFVVAVAWILLGVALWPRGEDTAAHNMSAPAQPAF